VEGARILGNKLQFIEPSGIDVYIPNVTDRVLYVMDSTPK